MVEPRDQHRIPQYGTGLTPGVPHRCTVRRPRMKYRPEKGLPIPGVRRLRPGGVGCRCHFTRSGWPQTTRSILSATAPNFWFIQPHLSR